MPFSVVESLYLQDTVSTFKFNISFNLSSSAILRFPTWKSFNFFVLCLQPVFPSSMPKERFRAGGETHREPAQVRVAHGVDVGRVPRVHQGTRVYLPTQCVHRLWVQGWLSDWAHVNIMMLVPSCGHISQFEHNIFQVCTAYNKRNLALFSVFLFS